MDLKVLHISNSLPFFSCRPFRFRKDPLKPFVKFLQNQTKHFFSLLSKETNSATCLDVCSLEIQTTIFNGLVIYSFLDKKDKSLIYSFWYSPKTRLYYLNFDYLLDNDHDWGLPDSMCFFDEKDNDFTHINNLLLNHHSRLHSLLVCDDFTRNLFFYKEIVVDKLMEIENENDFYF